MNNSSEHKSYWSLRLLALLQEMAAQKTNAVLSVLSNVERLETECRYPESGLLFADRQWRAFYHCHEAASLHANEHGHFHLFTNIGKRGWAHVAGLSIDAEGQPLQWFAVNRWVTDGPWLERENFLNQLKYVVAGNEEDDLVGSWLATLLQLYRSALAGLLEERDEQVQRYLKGRGRSEMLDDRDIYTLATQEIDLQLMLEKNLLHNQANLSESITNEPYVPQEA